MEISLVHGRQKVSIGDGELLSYQADGHEFMHQKGSPGWRSTDTEMFPVIGPTAEAGYRVQVPKGNAIQDQHGLLREMPYEQTEHGENTARFVKKYTAGNLVPNSKYPDKSTAKLLLWPYSFHFTKSFELDDTGLSIYFEITGDKGMPFMLGYHPAFKLNTAEPLVSTAKVNVSLGEVLAAGSRALQVPDANRITLKDDRELTLETNGFRHFMLWTEVPGMICIEPITFYPYSVTQRQLHQGFDYLEEERSSYSVHLMPG
jgi:galactose mutarotase-like enzyme